MGSRLADPAQRFELRTRQRQVLALLARGKTNAEIAQELGITLDGAKYHVREILGKVGAGSREEAVAIWQSRQRPEARVARWARAIFVTSSIRAAGITAAGVAAIGTAVVVLVALNDSGNDDKDSLANPTEGPSGLAMGPTSIPTIDTAQLLGCPDGSVTWRYEVRGAGESREIHLFAESTEAPCRLSSTAQFSILSPSGEPADVSVNGTTLGIDAVLPSDRLVAGLIWSNWCQGASPVLQLRAGTQKIEAVAADPPACTDASFASKLGPLAIEGAPPPPTQTPLAGGLAPALSPPETVKVAIYPDAQPGSSNCIEIIGDMVPAAAAGHVAAKEYSCDGDFSRVSFAVDSRGLHYVFGIELLLIGKVTLPQPRFGDGTCNSIREHLLDGSEDPESAAYVLVCEVQPLPRGAPGTPASGVIWARLPDGTGPATLPSPETPCWALSRYLGPPRGRGSYDVQCSLE